MGPELVRRTRPQDRSSAVEVVRSLHAGEGQMGLPRSVLPAEAERFHGCLEGRRDRRERLGALDAHPDDVHPSEARKRAGPPHPDLERADARRRLSHRRDDLGHEALFGVPEELQREVELVRGHDLQGTARLPKFRRQVLKALRRRDVRGDEPAERHDTGPPAPDVAATNRPRSSNVPRRRPSRTAVRSTFSASTRETCSSSARSSRSRVPRARAMAATWASARSLARNRRWYAKKNRPGTTKTAAHKEAAVALRVCWRAAPATARIAEPPAIASAEA